MQIFKMTTNNLTQYLKNIADAIRAKKKTTQIINAQDFANEIGGIEEYSLFDWPLKNDFNAYKYYIKSFITIESLDNANVKIRGFTSNEDYSYAIDWGDGSVSEFEQIAEDVTILQSHTYSSVGNYVITLYVITDFTDDGLLWIENMPCDNNTRELIRHIIISSKNTVGSNDSYYFDNLETFTFYSSSYAHGGISLNGCKKLKRVALSDGISFWSDDMWGNLYDCPVEVIDLSNATEIPTLDRPFYPALKTIWVPKSLEESFKTATNWSYYANIIKGV